MALTGCAGNDDYDPLDTAPDVLSPPVLVHPTREEVQAEVCAQPPEFFGPADTSTQRYPAKYPNGVTVIYHRGHEEPDNIVAAQAVYLNEWGFDVAVLDMPPGDHNDYQYLDHGLCYFVAPVFQMVNLLESEGQRVYMVGISAGGWTTVLAAAMDGRIERSYPVSGTMPEDLAGPVVRSDWEEWHLREIVMQRDLYALAAHQLVVQNKYDPCCFAGEALLTVDAGPNWSAVVDDTHRKHKVSSWALQVIVADMLEGMP